MLLLLAFLLPLAIYCFILSLLNRRSHPLMISGVWDFIGLLFGVSGLILIWGPAILSSFSQRWRMFWVAGDSPVGLEAGSGLWLLVFALYFTVVAAGSAYLLLQRRNTVSVYNIVPHLFDDVLAEVLNGLGFSWTRTGHRIFIRAPAVPEEAVQTTAITARPPEGNANRPTPSAPGSGEPSAELTLEPFGLLRHMTLRWESGDELLRQEIEVQLDKALRHVTVRSNPVAAWLLGLGTVLLFVTFFGMAATLVILYARQ